MSICYKPYVSSRKKCKKTTKITKVTCSFCINKLLREKKITVKLVETGEDLYTFTKEDLIDLADCAATDIDKFTLADLIEDWLKYRKK